MSFSNLLREFRRMRSTYYSPSDAALVSQYLALPIEWELDVSQSDGYGNQYARLFGQADFGELRRYFEGLVASTRPLEESERSRMVKLVALNNAVQSHIERQRSNDQRAPGSYFVSVPHWLEETLDPESGKSMISLLADREPSSFEIGCIAVLRAI